MLQGLTDFILKCVLVWLKFMVYGSFAVICGVITLMLVVYVFLKALVRNW